MKNPTPIAVASRSFCAHTTLRNELEQKYENITWNTTGRVLDGAELAAFLKGHTKAITGLERIDAAVLREIPELKHISKYGVGMDMIQLPDLEAAGVTLGWTAGVNRLAVAELALTFFLTLIRGVHLSSAYFRAEDFKRASGRQLSGKTIGIIGCGNIGKELVRMLKPFGCRVLAYDILDYSEFYRENGVTSMSLDSLLREADLVTIHVPKNKTTANLLNRERILSMKKGAFLVNTARGGLVDEAALQEALAQRHLAGAALDVLNEEPPTDWSQWKYPNLFITPHIGGGSEEAVLAMGRAAIENLENPQSAMSYEGKC